MTREKKKDESKKKKNKENRSKEHIDKHAAETKWILKNKAKITARPKQRQLKTVL